MRSKSIRKRVQRAFYERPMRHASTWMISAALLAPVFRIPVKVATQPKPQEYRVASPIWK